MDGLKVCKEVHYPYRSRAGSGIGGLGEKNNKKCLGGGGWVKCGVEEGRGFKGNV